jgi:hypothetical protein
MARFRASGAAKPQGRIRFPKPPMPNTPPGFEEWK